MAEYQQKPCAICKLEQQHMRVWDGGKRLSYQCPRCGKYTITRTAETIAERKELGPKLSAWIRDLYESGTETPEINSDSLRGIEAALPSYTVSQKQLILLRALERKTKFPGELIDATPRFDYPLAWASREEEFIYLLRVLIKRGLVQRVDGPPGLSGSSKYKVEITGAGWAFLDEHARPSVISDQVFVAMSFAPDLKSAWEQGIRPALSHAGFKPYRVDTDPHIDRIDTKIISEIKNSKFIVADVTQQRPGVYFEAGYAMGLGLPVFWCVRKDEIDTVHFDTRQYNHIVWETEVQLAEQLYFLVTAIIGKGSAT